MRRCSRCKTEKPDGEFYADASRPDGVGCRCRDCERERQGTEEFRSRRSAAASAWAKRNPERHAANARAYRSRNQEKVRAQSKIQHEVRVGRVVRPDTCEECGGAGKIEAHHHDYSKPLDVDWLCRSCHLSRHGKKPRVETQGREGGE